MKDLYLYNFSEIKLFIKLFIVLRNILKKLKHVLWYFIHYFFHLNFLKNEKNIYFYSLFVKGSFMKLITIFI